MGKMSRAKGARGERELAKFLETTLQVMARRGQQFSGSVDSPDVVTSIPELHIEVKRTESLSIYKAMEQAENDADWKLPVVFHKRNNREWLCVIKGVDIERFTELIRSRVKHVQEKSNETNTQDNEQNIDNAE